MKGDLLESRAFRRTGRRPFDSNKISPKADKLSSFCDRIVEYRYRVATCCRGIWLAEIYAAKPFGPDNPAVGRETNNTKLSNWQDARQIV